MDSHLPRFTAAIAVCALAFTATANAAKVVPEKAVPGATVELRGSDVPKTGKVKVAGKSAEVVSRRKSGVRFVVPRVAAGPRPVRIGDAQATMRVLERFRGKVGVELAKKRSDRKKIGPGGGSITAKHDGIKYTLDVPAGALSDIKRISMTPVAELKNLPLTRNRPAAVQLRPNGLKFRTPVELSITGLKKPGNQVGFTMTDKGRALELVAAERRGKRVVVAIEHFSTPGAGGATEQDFVNFLTQFLTATGAILTRGQVETLLVELDIAQDRFEHFCVTQEVLCEAIFLRVRRSLRRLINEECDRQTAQPSIGGLRTILELAADLQDLVEATDVPDCVQDILEALAGPAIENVATDPFVHSDTAEFQLSSIALADLNGDGELAWIEWVYYLTRWAQRFGGDDLASRLTNAFTDAMEKTLVDGKALCESSDPEEGRALLERGYAIARATGYLESDFGAALVECGCDGGSARGAKAAQTCPVGADLEVDVVGPSTAALGSVAYTVKVTNHGADTVAYTLELDTDNRSLRCGDYDFETQHPQAALAPGATRSTSYTVTCEEQDAPGGEVWLDAKVIGPADPPDQTPANNQDRQTTTMS